MCRHSRRPRPGRRAARAAAIPRSRRRPAAASSGARRHVPRRYRPRRPAGTPRPRPRPGAHPSSRGPRPPVPRLRPPGPLRVPRARRWWRPRLPARRRRAAAPGRGPVGTRGRSDAGRWPPGSGRHRVLRVPSGGRRPDARRAPSDARRADRPPPGRPVRWPRVPRKPGEWTSDQILREMGVRGRVGQGQENDHRWSSWSEQSNSMRAAPRPPEPSEPATSRHRPLLAWLRIQKAPFARFSRNHIWLSPEPGRQ